MLITFVALGALLKAMGKLDEARPLFEEALHAFKETLWATATRARWTRRDG